MSTDGLKIINWDKFRTYRKDRGGTQPYIKVSQCLLNDKLFSIMTDIHKAQYFSLLLLATRYDGNITLPIERIQELCSLEEPIDVDFFVDNKLIEYHSPQGDLFGSRSQKKTKKQPNKRDKAPKIIKALASKYPPEFEEFWELYPRRKNKHTAYESWKHIPEIMHQEVMDGLRLQIKTRKDWHGVGREQFIPYPSTWLNNTMWREEETKPIRNPDQFTGQEEIQF